MVNKSSTLIAAYPRCAAGLQQLHTPPANNEGKGFKFKPRFSTRIFASSAVLQNEAVDNPSPNSRGAL